MTEKYSMTRSARGLSATAELLLVLVDLTRTLYSRASFQNDLE